MVNCLVQNAVKIYGMNCLNGTYFVYTSLSMFAYVCESEQLVYMYVCVCKCERHWHDIY